MSDDDEQGLMRHYALPAPINLSKLAMEVVAAVEKLKEYERIHGPISKKGPKVGKGRLTRRGIKK